MSLGPGSTIGPFKIQALIGKGGMGEVFSALDTRLDRRVALKILPPDFASDADRLRRFQSEAKVLAALSHPNILVIHEVGTENSNPYLVSELLEGRTLREELGRDDINGVPRIPVRKALDYALQIAHGLAAAHARGIIHRDLKPENIFITKDGRIKILDFGLAKSNPVGTRSTASPSSFSGDATQHVPANDIPTLLQSTVPGLILGTPAYMSPEQVRGEPADHRSDLFAFGCVLYEMLRGVPPFRRSAAVETMHAVLNEDPSEFDSDNQAREIPIALERIVRRSLEKNPENRFQSASDLAFALEALSGSTAASGFQRNPEAAKKRLHLLLIAAAIVIFPFLIFLAGRSSRSGVESPVINWQGERLDGPLIAMIPRVSPDGKELAFTAMVNGQTQLALMNIATGEWHILTTNRDRGLVGYLSWSTGGDQIYFDRMSETPNGVYRISKYGGEERLILPGAVAPEVISNESILLARRDANGLNHLNVYSPGTEQLREMNALSDWGMVVNIRVLPGANAAVFSGRTTNDLAAPSQLWLLDLTTGQSRPFLTNVIGRSQFRDPLAFTFNPSDSSFVFDRTAAGLHSLLSVNLKHPAFLRQLLPLTSAATALDMDRNGNIFCDQFDRPNEILRVRANGPLQRMPLPSLFESSSILPLPGDRFLFNVISRGMSRLMIIKPGKEPERFLEGNTEAGAPFCRLGPDQVVFTVREGSRYSLAAASFDGRLVRRTNSLAVPGARGVRLAGSPDGKTIYYAAGGFVYAVPWTGGVPEKLHTGESMAIDSAGKYLIIKVNHPEGNYLLRYSLLNRTEERLPRSRHYPLASDPLGPHAIAPDGRLVVQVAPVDSWFWPAAILNPQTGELTLATDYQADMFASGWDSNGDLVLSAAFLRSSIWRFGPEKPLNNN